MVELDRVSSSFDVSGVQPHFVAWSEDWCWSASAVFSFCLYGLSAAHLVSEVVVHLLDGSGSGEGIGVSWCWFGGGKQAGHGSRVVAVQSKERRQVGGLGRVVVGGKLHMW